MAIRQSAWNKSSEPTRTQELGSASILDLYRQKSEVFCLSMMLGLTFETLPLDTFNHFPVSVTPLFCPLSNIVVLILRLSL